MLRTVPRAPTIVTFDFTPTTAARSRFSNLRFGLKPLCAAVPSERSVRVAVIGLGYVGLPLAATVAATGANVIGVDIDLEKVKAVNAGESPLQGQEPGLAELLKEQVSKGHLRASLEASAVSGADVVAVCVETPIDPTTHDPSYKALKAALAEIAPVLKRGALVSIESTLAPGTMEGVVRPALERGSKRTVGRDLYLVHCPERLTTGKLLHHLTELPRVLGANDAVSTRKALAFYARFVKAEVHPTDWTTAEVVKTAENAYWDVQIAFANEVALISEELGVDAYRVRELVNTCPYRMMLIPGAGVGGHCIPKDSWLLVSPAVQSKPELIPTAREVPGEHGRHAELTREDDDPGAPATRCGHRDPRSVRPLRERLCRLARPQSRDERRGLHRTRHRPRRIS
ncbi:MAG: nucleotide sugar dehydrogenase [Methanobacteriota archaeon]|nr:MAG: nucleotide sugar dehydrogenase [Euryarchaeota archaeon]